MSAAGNKIETGREVPAARDDGVSARDTRKAYAPPKLETLGHVANVTKKSGPLADNPGNQNNTRS